jgi:hypothetical protein
MSRFATVLNTFGFGYLSTNAANRPWTKTCVHLSPFVASLGNYAYGKEGVCGRNYRLASESSKW